MRSWRDRREFVELPYRLHANDEQWIPPLRLERHLFILQRLNPFFRHGEGELFLARRDGRVVGRISAQIDHEFNAYQGNDWGMFGFIELEDDSEAMGALLDDAEVWEQVVLARRLQLLEAVVVAGLLEEVGFDRH